jgi:uncharacterized membrane protein YgaE (UPF0421/DUF939 family)
MEYNEFVLLGIGTAISVLGFFLKKESVRLKELEDKVSELEITLVKNGVRDVERWDQTSRALEDRRADVRKLYDLVQKAKG